MRILLVEDHIMFREGLASLLRSQPDLEIVGETGSASQAIALALALWPDVILMDFSLPDGNGPDVTRAILAQRPEIKVVFLSMHDSNDHLFAALHSGASGYLLKSLPIANLVESLNALNYGEAPISRKMAASLVQEFARLGPPHMPDQSKLSSLTLREVEVLEELVAGYSNQEIALRLSISETTVKNHVHSILGKLGLKNRQEAARFARNQGLHGMHSLDEHHHGYVDR